ncbi:MAG: DNA-processing protein DprA [Flavobacteriaceae bacterium]
MNHLEACLTINSLPGVGWHRSIQLVSHFGSAKAVLEASPEKWITVEGLGEKACISLSKWKQELPKVQRQIKELERYAVRPLFYGSPDYPLALGYCPDAPLVLFTKGTLQFKKQPIISIVGTRTSSAHGRDFCRQLIEKIRPFQPIICSGLARGIDIVAHRTALEEGLETIACLGHGFDRIYPPSHQKEAHQIEKQGLLVTDFLPNSEFHRANFPRRNRLIAGMSHATVVIESAVEGGSMNTANLAHQYGRELFAVPGRPSDVKSGGCHQLIVQQKAQLLTDPVILIEALGWKEQPPLKSVQRAFFQSLSEEEEQLYKKLSQAPKIHLDALAMKLGWPISHTASILLQMEMKGLVRALPGKHFEWI